MKNQKGEVPRAGDRAILIAYERGFTKYGSPLIKLGAVVSVTSDPFFHEEDFYIGGKAIVSNFSFDGLRYRSRTAHLLRIPPDEEAKQLFAEKDESKPKKVKA